MVVLFGRPGAALAVGALAIWTWGALGTAPAPVINTNPEVMIAREAFKKITALKYWKGAQTVLPGCYILDGTATGVPNLAYFTDSDLEGFAYITCKTGPVGGVEQAVQVVSAHVGLGALATFKIPDEFYEELKRLTVPLQTLELKSMNIGGLAGGSVPGALMDLTALIELKIGNNQIETMPATIKDFKAMQYVDLTQNKLSVLPDMAGMVSMQYLFLGENKLTAIDSIGALTTLKTLMINDNQLEALPANIAKLVNLEYLMAGNNKLERLVTAIGSCTALIEINLEYNALTALPSQIGLLTKLEGLNVRNNRLNSLPPEISTLAELNMLNIAENNFQTLPNWIDKLPKLTTLYAQQNSINAVPAPFGLAKSLMVVNLANNEITQMPDLTKLQVLISMDAHSNLIQKFPEVDCLRDLKTLDLRNNLLVCNPRTYEDAPEWIRTGGATVPIGVFACDDPKGETCEMTRTEVCPWQDTSRAVNHRAATAWLVSGLLSLGYLLL